MQSSVCRSAWVLAAVLLVTTVAACGGKVPTKPKHAETAPIPTVTEMDAWLRHAIDPTIPAAEKQDLVQGSIADPDLVSKVLSLYSTEGAKLQVKDVVKRDPTSIIVDADLDLWSETRPQQVPFVYDGGVWKIEKDYACRLTAVLNLSSPACV
ncbi:hypothetical protein [Smaragdicoccus niigatensis]|uniref:hypothetical protein n=1 Tax=Smaragdicoccus niigatensis TaxID=359359 RepID=UPI0003728400|nr:hypothetical protein [Smaragdicoccus niigatensis]